MSDKDAQNWALICHLSSLSTYVIPVPGMSIVAPLIIWNLKGKEHPFVDDQGKEAVNFQISMLIYAAIAALTLCVGIGFFVLLIVAVVQVVFVVIAAIKSSNGEAYRYPLTIRMIK